MKQHHANALFSPCQRSAGQSNLTYTLCDTCGTYSLLICSDERSEGRILVRDIARDLHMAEKIQAILAENLVFPVNVPEVLDDLLGNGRDI